MKQSSRRSSSGALASCWHSIFLVLSWFLPSSLPPCSSLSPPSLSLSSFSLSLPLSSFSLSLFLSLSPLSLFLSFPLLDHLTYAPRRYFILFFQTKKTKTKNPVGNALSAVVDGGKAVVGKAGDAAKAVVGKAGDAAKAVTGAADSALSKITQDDKKKIAIAGGVALAVAGGVLAWQNAPEADKERVRAKGRETKAWIKKTDASAKKSVNDAAQKVKDRAEADTAKTKQALKDAEKAAKKKADEVAARARAEADKLRGKVDKKADKTAKAVDKADAKGRDFVASIKAIFGQ